MLEDVDPTSIPSIELCKTTLYIFYMEKRAGATSSEQKILVYDLSDPVTPRLVKELSSYGKELNVVSTQSSALDLENDLLWVTAMDGNSTDLETSSTRKKYLMVFDPQDNTSSSLRYVTQLPDDTNLTNVTISAVGYADDGVSYGFVLINRGLSVYEAWKNPHVNFKPHLNAEDVNKPSWNATLTVTASNEEFTMTSDQLRKLSSSPQRFLAQP